MIKIIIFNNQYEASKYCAKKIVELIKNKPDTTLGLATGRTFIDTYKLLVKDHVDNKLSFNKVKTFNLDEYINCNGTEKWSYKYFMNEQLFKHLDIEDKNIHFPISINSSPATLSSYDKLVEKSKIDLQLLGVGTNGHIAFNEPKSNTEYFTHEVQLEESTIQNNAKYFFDGKIENVPKRAISMGIKNILSAKNIILMALGKDKADAIAKYCNCDDTDSFLPISYLNLHSSVEILLDKDASISIDSQNMKNKKVVVEYRTTSGK